MFVFYFCVTSNASKDLLLSRIHALLEQKKVKNEFFFVCFNFIALFIGLFLMKQ